MKHTPRKRFGQNFLQDQGIIHQIIECINPQAGQRLVEIGPGLAALTAPLIAKQGHIDVIEIDRDIINHLQQRFSKEQLTIHEGDALKFDFSFNRQAIRVVGNLPYNISTPLMFHLSQFPNIENMTFMLQKEVVERICAAPNCTDYGRLSVMLQARFKCRYLLDVPPECFYPAPKVDSAIVSLAPLAREITTDIDFERLGKVVSQAFNQRRKTIANSLKGLVTSVQLESLAINPSWRPENLSVSDYIRLSQLPPPVTQYF